MITNKREYSVTRGQVSRLATALANARGRQPGVEIDPLIHAAELQAMESEHRRLQSELDEYDALERGETPRRSAARLQDLPEVLIQARIASGMTQRELAEGLGIREQQVQRYEATRYRGASFDRLVDIARLLGVHVEQTALFAAPTLRRAVGRLESLGFPRGFLETRILEDTADAGDASVVGVAGLRNLERVFGWSPEQFAAATELRVEPAFAGGALFKTPKGRQKGFLEAYTAYAYRLAVGAAKCAAHLPQAPVPSDANAARLQAVGSGTLTLARLCDWAWSLGVVVIPLNDAAAFHGAFWRIQGRNVIILKQRTESTARWMHDLLHEIYHSSLEPDLPQRTVLDTYDAMESRDKEEEDAATFASDVLLGGRANDLALECIAEAKRDIARLKGAVPKVAQRSGVRADVLANHLAWILDRQPGERRINWWGTAKNLQSDSSTDLSYAWRLCIERLVPPASADLDVDLLYRALRSRLEGAP